MIPPIVFPGQPTSSVQPFTYKDGLTYLQRLERIVKYINRELIPYIDAHYNELAEAFETQVNELITQVNALVQSIIDDSIELQDEVLMGILENAESDARQLLDTLYATTEAVDAVYVAIDEAVAPIKANIVYASEYGVDSALADNRAQLIAAFDAVNEGGTLNIPYSDTPYTVSEFLDFTGKSFTLEGNGATIKRAGTEASRHTVKAGGGITSGAAVVVTSIAKGATTVNLASINTVAVGDVIQIRSTTEVFDLSRPDVYFKGEIAIVKAVVGSQITLASPTLDAYTLSGSNILIDRILAKKVVIQNLNLVTDISATAMYGLSIIGHKNAVIDNVHVTGFKRQGIQVGNGHTLNVTRSSATGSNEVGLGYGIIIWATNAATIDSFVGIGNRHTVDIGGGPADVPSRAITYSNIRAFNDSSSGISSHGQYDGLDIINCSTFNCGGGIIVRGSNTKIIGCRVLGMSVTSETYAGALVVGDGTPGNPGLGGVNLTVTDSTFDYTGVSGSWSGLHIFSDVDNVAILNNTFINMPQYFILVQSDKTKNMRVQGNVFSSNRALGSPADYLVLIDPTGTDTRDGFDFSNNKVYCSTGQYISIVRVAGGAAVGTPYSNVKIDNNVLNGYGTNAIQLNTGFFAGEVAITNNEIPSSTLHIGASATFATPIVNMGNRLGGTNGTFKDSVGTAAPTSGTWARGQKVWNVQPSAAGYTGWVCVTAGTPGTWKGFGLIQA